MCIQHWCYPFLLMQMVEQITSYMLLEFDVCFMHLGDGPLFSYHCRDVKMFKVLQIRSPEAVVAPGAAEELVWRS